MKARFWLSSFLFLYASSFLQCVQERELRTQCLDNEVRHVLGSEKRQHISPLAVHVTFQFVQTWVRECDVRCVLRMPGKIVLIFLTYVTSPVLV